MKGSININAEICKECGLCIIYCKQALIIKSDTYNAKGYFPARFEDGNGKCTACGTCALVCPELAIEVYGEETAHAR